MKRLLPTLVLLLPLAGAAGAEQIEIQHVSELIKPAEVIARVSVLSVRETGAQKGYTKIALVRVTDAIKGLEGGSTFELENDKAYVACPNVRYSEGEDVLLFAKRLPNGNYVTVYADAGKFLIKGGKVGKQPFKEGQSYDSARAEIESEMKKLEKGGPS